MERIEGVGGYLLGSMFGSPLGHRRMGLERQKWAFDHARLASR